MKRAYTLAEVFLALGVIGVLSAITLPTLMQDTSNSQVEPKLNKIQSVIVQANKDILYRNGADSLLETGFFTGFSTVSDDYYNELNRTLKMTGSYTIPLISAEGASKVEKFYQINDGTAFKLVLDNILNLDLSKKTHKTVIGKYIIDINGRGKPNEYGRDIFELYAMNDGSITKYNVEG